MHIKSIGHTTLSIRLCCYGFSFCCCRIFVFGEKRVLSIFFGANRMARWYDVVTIVPDFVVMMCIRTITLTKRKITRWDRIYIHNTNQTVSATHKNVQTSSSFLVYFFFLYTFHLIFVYILLSSYTLVGTS